MPPKLRQRDLMIVPTTAVVKMMTRNPAIVELLLQASPQVEAELGLCLFVNQHRELLENENISKKQLVDLLSLHVMDHTFLFLFLRAKPELCGII